MSYSAHFCAVALCIVKMESESALPELMDVDAVGSTRPKNVVQFGLISRFGLTMKWLLASALSTD